MYRSSSKLGFKRNSSLYGDNILSRVSTSSGVWINGSKELLRYNLANFLKLSKFFWIFSILTVRVSATYSG